MEGHTLPFRLVPIHDFITNEVVILILQPDMMSTESNLAKPILLEIHLFLVVRGLEGRRGYIYLPL